MKQNISIFAFFLLCVSYQSVLANDFYMENWTADDLDIELRFIGGHKQQWYAPRKKWDGTTTKVGPISVTAGCLASVGIKAHGPGGSYGTIEHIHDSLHDWHSTACNSGTVVISTNQGQGIGNGGSLGIMYIKNDQSSYVWDKQ